MGAVPGGPEARSGGGGGGDGVCGGVWLAGAGGSARARPAEAAIVSETMDTRAVEERRRGIGWLSAREPHLTHTRARCFAVPARACLCRGARAFA